MADKDEEKKQAAEDQVQKLVGFKKELQKLINKHCIESESNTADFILAEFLMSQLNSFNAMVRQRDIWYDGKVREPAQ